MSTLDKARSAWGKSMPDWVKALAEACDTSSLRKTAVKLGVSPATISLAINKKRKKLDFIKIKVESVLMVAAVTCPALGAISMLDCLREQAKPFSSANPLRIQIYRACRNGCPHYKGTQI